MFLALEDSRNTFAQQRVIVDDHNPDYAGNPHSFTSDAKSRVSTTTLYLIVRSPHKRAFPVSVIQLQYRRRGGSRWIISRLISWLSPAFPEAPNDPSVPRSPSVHRCRFHCRGFSD